MRKRKLIVLIALVVAITCMTIGFATFSSTLTIFSKANVTPDGSGFDLKMYGLVGGTYNGWLDFNNYTSESDSSIYFSDSVDFVSVEQKAEIDNSLMSINVGTINLSSPSSFYATFIRVENRGQYDVYFDAENFPAFVEGVCTAGEGTSVSLVQEVCPYIFFGIESMVTEETLEAERKCIYGELEQETFEDIRSYDCFYNRDGVCKLETGKNVIFNLGVFYDPYGQSDSLADGPFSVSFSDLILNFTTDSTGYIES